MKCLTGTCVVVTLHVDITQDVSSRELPLIWNGRGSVEELQVTQIICMKSVTYRFSKPKISY